MLHPELASIAAIQTRFLREGYVANRIAHEGVVRVVRVVRVVDDDDDDAFHTAFLVLELLEGETIAERVAQNARAATMDEIVHWGDRLLDILAAAHDVGVVHRDIKPENLFLTQSRRVAARNQETTSPSVWMESALTAALEAIGTAAVVVDERGGVKGANKLAQARFDRDAHAATTELKRSLDSEGAYCVHPSRAANRPIFFWCSVTSSTKTA